MIMSQFSVIYVTNGTTYTVSKMSNNDLKSFLHVENPIFYKNSSIKTMPKKTREMMKPFCQMNQWR